MAHGFQRTPRLKRRLLKWQIFFIGIGGVIGVGFFQGASKTVGIAGPGGALMATIIVGLVAVAVMEAICHMICIWPIPNAMVEFVQTFVDEDLGTSIGVLYWYTYCVTFSVLISSIGSLSDYWGDDYMRKSIIYIVAPLVLLAINAAPVEVFGWVEFLGGIVKLALVVGIFLLMLLLNLGVNTNHIVIGTTFIDDSFQHDDNVATNNFAAVATCFPLAIFAFIGVELLTTTAFEARDPHEMRFAARNIAWFTLVLYGLSTGVFVSDVFWGDSNLPLFFNQALESAMPSSSVQWVVSDINPQAHAAPLITLLRLGYSFLPGFINGCLIYSALSCANTSLYVASRQLYGLTRTITITNDSNFVRKFLAWLGRVEHRTRSPWPALLVSVLVLYWLPFINKHDNYSAMDNVQTILSSAGSVSCILVWSSQCIAYLFFYNWREQHREQIASKTAFRDILAEDNTGWFNVFQPYLTYLATFATIAIVVFFNTASMWHGGYLHIKALSAFASPAVLLVVYLIKKFTRKDRIRFWKDLSRWYDFETQLQYLNDLIYPDEPDLQSDHGSMIGQEMKPPNTVIHENRSLSDVSTNFGVGNNDNSNRPEVHQPQPSWAIGDLQLTPHNPAQLSKVEHNQPVNQALLPSEEHGTSISPVPPERSIDTTAEITDSPVDYRSPSGLGSNLKYYDGRNNLSPQDAVTYAQSTSPSSEMDVASGSDRGLGPATRSREHPVNDDNSPVSKLYHPDSAIHSHLRPYTHPSPLPQHQSHSPTPSRSLPQLHSQGRPKIYSPPLAPSPLSTIDSIQDLEVDNSHLQGYHIPRRRHIGDPDLIGAPDTRGATPGPSFRDRAMNAIPTTWTTPTNNSSSTARFAADTRPRTSNNTTSTSSQSSQFSIHRRPIAAREVSGSSTNTLSSIPTPPPRLASPTSPNIHPRIPPLHSHPPSHADIPSWSSASLSATSRPQPSLPESLRIGTRRRQGSSGLGGTDV